jgi:hypothetical protein
MTNPEEPGRRPWWKPSPGVLVFLVVLCGMCGFCLWGATDEDRARGRATQQLTQGRSLSEAVLAIQPEDRRFSITLRSVPELDPPFVLSLRLRGDMASLEVEGGGPGHYRPLAEALDALQAQIAPLTSLSYEGQANWTMAYDTHASLPLKVSREGVLTQVGGP